MYIMRSRGVLHSKLSELDQRALQDMSAFLSMAGVS